MLIIPLGCGDTLPSNSPVASDGLGACNSLCKGNASEFCGGPSLLDVYNFNGSSTIPPPLIGTPTTNSTSPAAPKSGQYTYYGCVSEGTNVRALSAKASTSPVMSVEACEVTCFGYTYYGIEYGQECKFSFSETKICVELIFVNRLLWKQFRQGFYNGTRRRL